MNMLFTLRCDACSAPTNIRFGMSNRAVQPVRFCCQTCGSAIDMTLHLEKGGDLVGATQIPDHVPFGPEENFVDLHLDFPVSFDKYVMGLTPFMRALGRISEEQMQYHRMRLSLLNGDEPLHRVFGMLLKLYEREKWMPFKLNCFRNFDIKIKSDTPQDLNAALYSVIARVMAPFTMPGQDQETSEYFSKMLMTLGRNHKEAMSAYMTEIIETKFLKNLQIDCLHIYPNILNAELPMRPALFLDFDEAYKEEKAPMRVSTDQFVHFKDLFKDIAEILSRQMVLVAGINNILNRDNHNKFKPEIGKRKDGKDFTPKSMNAYADVALGQKMAFIDDPWFEPIEGATNNQLRNAIAHNKLNYDDITQSIEYFPRKEGILEEKAEHTTFLDFMYQLLIAYRQMHALHHLIKGLFYYQYIAPK